MLERATGNIRFDDVDLTIGPGLTRAAFLGAKLQAWTHAANEPWHSWFLPRCTSGLVFSATLFFEGERLYEMHLVNADPRFGTSWMTYSEEKERAKQETHDAWLIGRCCVPPGSYPWGIVWSGLLKQRDRLATIVIQYRPD